MKTIESKANVVQLMRRIRDQLNADIQNMTLEQQKAYMSNFLKVAKSKNRVLK